MSLESIIEKLIAVVEKNNSLLIAAASKGGPTVVAGTEAKTEVKADKVGLTFEVMKASATKVMDKQGKPFAKNLITTIGKSKEMATVKPENYKALMAEFEKALAEKPAPAEADEDEDDEL